MIEDNSNTRTPIIRFQGFNGEWEKKKIGDIAIVLQGYGFPEKYQGQKYGDLPFCKVGDISSAVDRGEMVINKADNFVDYSLLPVLHAQPIPVGSTIFAKIGEAIRSNKRIRTGVPCLIDNNAAAVKSKGEISDTFLFYLMSKVNLADYSGGIVPSVNKSTIEAIDVLVPSSRDEQQKIAECLEAIDQMISAQNQKVESLKAHKKGLMQQLFPQPGATTPALRFPGFEEFWEEKKLGDICDSILVGFPFKGQDITDNSSGHPILRAYSIGEGIIRHGKDYDKYYPGDTKPLERYKVSTGDIVISMDGSVGRNIALVSDDENGYLLIQRVARLRVTKYPVQLIYQQIISQRFKDYVAGEKVGAVIAHISQKQIESFPVFIPKSQQEQNKVADALTETDRLISTQEQKVESLKTHKKGLMQQLFPQLQK